MTSKIVVNNIEADAGVSTVTFGSKISSTEFVGPVVGNVTGNVTGNVVIGAGTTSAPSLSPSGDSNTGIFFPSADTIAFAEGGVEALRIDSNGDLQLTAATNGSNQSIQFGDPDASNRGLLQYRHGDDSLRVYVSASEKLHITSGGNVQIANGNLVFSTAGTGIDFSATANSSGTMTSELLNDYEEGTFTPTLLGGATSITLNASVNTLSYTKIGRRVFISGRINIGNLNGATGSLNFGGIPYVASSSGPGNSNYASIRVSYYNLDLPADGTGEIFIEIAGGSSGFSFNYLRDNATWSTINATAMSTSTYLYITGNYLATS